MSLKFCSECNSLLKIKETGEGKKLHCEKCNLIEEFAEDSLISSSEKEIHEEKRGEGVVKDINQRATYDHLCKKCGYDKAEIIDIGVLISDEDNLILLKCGRCGFSERVGRKTS